MDRFINHLKIKKSQYIFNVLIAVIMAKFYLSTLMPNNFQTKYILVMAMAMSLIIVLSKVLSIGIREYIIQNKLYIIFIGIIFLISLLTGNGEWLYTAIVLMGLKEYDFDKFMKSYLIISIIYFIAIIILNLTGIKPTNTFYAGGVARYDLGFNNPNRAMFAMFTIWISYFYVRGRKLTYIDKLILLLLPIIIYIPTRTRTAMLTIFTIIIIYLILRYLDITNKKICILLASIPLLISSISFILANVFNNNELLNNILSRRPQIWGMFFDNADYPIKLFGYDNNIIDIIANGGNLTLDNAYISLLFKNGIIMFILIMSIYTIMIYYLSKLGDKVGVILVIAILVYAFGESMFIDISSNPLIMLIPFVFKSIQKRSL